MTDRSRRAFLGTIGTTIGGTLLVKEGLKRAASALETNPEHATPSTVSPDSLRVETASRELAAQRHARHTELNTIENWDATSGRLTADRTHSTDNADAMRLTPTPAGSIEYTFDAPFDLSQTDLSFWAYFPRRPPSSLRV